MSERETDPDAPPEKVKQGRGNRTSNSALGDRIDDTERLLVNGVHRRKTMRLIMDKYEVSKRTASRYVKAAFERFRADALENDGKSTSELRAEHAAALQDLRLKAMKAGNLRVQLRCLQTMISLYGTADNTSKVELSGPGGGAIQHETMSDAELRQVAREAFTPDLKRVK